MHFEALNVPWPCAWPVPGRRAGETPTLRARSQGSVAGPARGQEECILLTSTTPRQARCREREPTSMVATPSGVTLWTDRKIPFVFAVGYPYKSETRAAMAV